MSGFILPIVEQGIKIWGSWLHFEKTKAEIKKTEAETNKIYTETICNRRCACIQNAQEQRSFIARFFVSLSNEKVEKEGQIINDEMK